MKIHIVGASCAGSTTLGMRLSVELGYPYFDSDNYFWERTDQPYTVKRSVELRNELLKKDITGLNDFIVGGSLVSWGEGWQSAFDLVVFLYVPPEIRMQRLHNRELERYGEAIFTDAERKRQYQEFVDWASAYDKPDNPRRSLAVHEHWLKQVTCALIEIRGDTTVDERINIIRESGYLG
ncbi:adenylate kinase [Mucilaginibacter sp. RS28]|uniref:Adenylate kinase n=1 Tax=Mucilaginibacter straminoryzae TaxID=2932774 RepID=A0A9X1X4Y5_9SPHI|nr:shikimate kinase [Mucilaginibacter straminoryzae]MCJ8211119.1 adenylate kinase [Mucilaginibacter straminoryzae]